MQISATLGISYAAYLNYESMKRDPFRLDGEMRVDAAKLCEFHGLGSDELFPEAVKNLVSRLVEKKFDAEEVGLLGAYEPKALPSPEDFMVDTELGERVDEVLKTLTPREERVVRMRFGLTEDGEALTQAETGVEFEVTTGRVHQIESQALRKLRHPRRSRVLRPYVDDQGDLRSSSYGTDVISQDTLNLLAAVFGAQPNFKTACVLWDDDEEVFFYVITLPVHRAPERCSVVYRHDCPGNPRAVDLKDIKIRVVADSNFNIVEDGDVERG
jgi:RNA polymerase sigma factor (sigma-70 family)